MTDETQPQENRPAAILVELEPGLACLFGESVPEGVDVVYPPMLPDRAATQIGTAVGTVVAGINLAAQAAGAAGALQGLVQLTPATLQALQTATPLTSGGANLGTLVDATGHFVHAVQWVPAGAAGAAAGLAAVGPAVALLAIQIQLANVTSLVQQSLALTDEVLRAVRIERWAEVTGLHEAMLKAVDEARHVGAVSDPIWQNVAAHEAILGKVRNEFREKVSVHLSSLDGKQGHQDHWEYLRHHGEAILRDAQALIRAQAAWFTYQAIRTGHLHHRSDTDPTAGKLLEKVVADARVVHDRDLQAAGELLHALHWRFSMMAELPGRPTLPFGKGKRAAKDVAHASRLLLDQLTILRQEIDLADPPVQTPVIAAFEGDVPDLLPRVLRWHLRPDEQLLALGSARGQAWPVKDWCYVAVTDERLLVAEKDALKSRGEIGTVLPLTDMRYVRFTPASNDGQKVRGRIEVTTPDVDVRLTFGEWAGDEGHQAEVARLAQLLRSRMCLPPAEIPSSPLTAEQVGPRDRSAPELDTP